MKRSYFNILLKRFLKGKSNPAETHLIQSYLNLVEQGFKDQPIAAERRTRIKEEIQDRIDANIAEIEVKKLHRKKLTHYTVAASVVLALIFGYYNFAHFNKDSHTIQFEDRVTSSYTPIENKARLVMSDGNIIELDKEMDFVLEDGVKQSISNEKIEGEGLLSFEMNQHSQNPALDTLFRTVITPKGGQYAIKLSDGSKVWLNSDSKLTFPEEFSTHERRVELIGEGYFEIQKDQNRPFFIHAKGAEIEVLGTNFNVNAYEDGSILKTTLLEGSVKIVSPVDEMILKPGEQAEMAPNSKFIREVVNAEEAVAWKHGYFYFYNDSLSEIMQMISRTYDVDVEYEGDFRKLSFGGKVSIKRPLSSILEMIELAGSVNFKQEGRRLIVTN